MAAPLGNQNAVKAKRWQQAIDRALAKRGKGDAIKALDELAEKFLSEVEASSITGFKELGDRLDGKPAQALDLSGGLEINKKAADLSDEELAAIVNGRSGKS